MWISVLQLVRRLAREPLDDLHVGAVAQAVAVQADARLIGEVRRLDDQRVAFPVAARVAHVLADLRADVRPSIERNDAGVVHHLVADRHFVRRLHDPVAVAVDDREDRSDDAARDAAVVVGEVRRALERPVAEGAAVARGPTRFGERRQRRQLAVAIDDQRGLIERLLEPRVVVAERAAAVVRPLTGGLVALQLVGELGLRQFDAAGKLIGPRERNANRAVARPGARKIGMSPRRLRRRPWLCRRGLCRRRLGGGG